MATVHEHDTPVPMLTRPQQARVWESLIAAEVRAKYFAELAHRYHVQQRAISWLMLVFSSGALISIIARLTYDWVAPLLALITSGLSFYSLVAHNEKKATDATDLHFKWSRLESEYESLWENMYDPDAREQLAKLDEKEIDLGRMSTGFPVNNTRLLKWQDHVEERRAALAHAA
jgi:hypothetical protein